MSDRPNVVFVLTDDQGYPPLGCHGHPFIQTPKIDSFYSDAVRLDQFHTGTTCAPTRAGLMTGHYCNSTGVWHTIGGRSLLRRNEWSLASALSEAGYATGMFGKWHLGDDYPYRPNDRGFQETVCHGGGGVSQQPDWWGNDYFDDTYWVNGEPQAFEGYCSDVFFAEGLKFIEAHQDEPFFCYISTNAPHGPFNVEPSYRDRYADNADSENYARFLGMITNIDENFGKLREKLQELGIEENTVLIFMSDNGQTGVGDPNADQYNAGMKGMKGSPYDGGHRVPFFVRWVDGEIRGGRDVTELTSYVDFMPTILNLCGVDVPADRSFHGESVRPLLEGDNSSPHWRQRVITTDTQRVANPLKWRLSCVMRDQYRLVNRTELYDLSGDPGQTKNIAPDQPEVVAELQDEYEAWWQLCAENIDDEVPVPIGAPGHDPVTLRTHDMRNELDHAVVWNQGQVRNGDVCHGWWEVSVEAQGEYEFDLRRWPTEAGHRVCGGIEGEDVEYREDGIAPGAEHMYCGGKALHFDTACLTVSGLPKQCVPIKPDDVGVKIRMQLPPGPRHVRAQFSSANGAYCSAYYVYVRKVD